MNNITYGSGAAMARARDNEQARCTVMGCGIHRDGFSNLCAKHRDVQSLRGHPLATRIQPSEWKQERLEVAALYAANVGHPGLQRGREYIQGLFDHHKAGTHAPRVDAEVRRLIDHGVTPLMVLTEVAAVFTFAQRRNVRIPDTKAEEHLMSAATLRLAPRPRIVTARSGRYSSNGFPSKPSMAALSYIGKVIRSSLLPVLVSTYAAVQAKAEQQAIEEAAAYEARHAAFSITPEAFKP